MQTSQLPRGNGRALIPLAVFLAIYAACSIAAGDFYKVPVSVAFLAASVCAVAMMRGRTLAQRMQSFSSGASDRNVMTMIWIFVLAGAFTRSAQAMGAVDATVALTLRLLPPDMLSAGFFVAACFVSLSVGTSVGTVVALVPVASGIAARTGIDNAWMTAVVVGGAFFGDNLSFISDTTIAATRTQGCRMRDKFLTNVRIVAPAAVLTLLLYIVTGCSHEMAAGAFAQQPPVQWWRIIPYVIVLAMAVAGVDVMAVLLAGLAAAGAVGIATGGFDTMTWLGEAGAGIASMGELIIITMLAGGMLEIIRINGGTDRIIYCLTRRVKGRRGAEACIAALVCMANVCTANNTVAIITVGSIARDVARRFGVDPRKSASLLDTFSCFTQGLLPYGAQLLMAAGLASLSPVEIIGRLFYPMIMGLCAVAAVIFNFPRLKPVRE